MRGLGVTVALPWMESVPVFADVPKVKSPGDDAPVRLGVLFAGNGFHKHEWWAKGDGRSMAVGKVLEPLQAFRDRMLFVRGL